MAELWIPTATPPQLSEEAQTAVLTFVLEEGVTPITKAALRTLQSEQEPLGEYLDRFGFNLNTQSTEGFWPERVLKMGASLTLLAYREMGYLHQIDTTSFEKGSAAALLQGIPEAYISSMYDDVGLVDLINTVVTTPELSNSEGGYEQVLAIGAGCTRFYIQQAIAA